MRRLGRGLYGFSRANLLAYCFGAISTFTFGLMVFSTGKNAARDMLVRGHQHATNWGSTYDGETET